MSEHDCAHNGHIWIEPDGKPYARHSKREKADVDVTCKHCPATASLPMQSKRNPNAHDLPPIPGLPDQKDRTK